MLSMTQSERNELLGMGYTKAEIDELEAQEYETQHQAEQDAD